MSTLAVVATESCIGVRPFAVSDGESVCALIRANGPRFSDAGLAQLPSDQVEYARWIAGAGQATALQALRCIYGIVLAERGRESLVGFVGVETLNRFHGAGVWYGLRREHQGRGLAKTGVMAAMADFAELARRQRHASPKAWVLHAMPRNTRSAGLAESIGFQRDELLDYTRSASARGGVRFFGYSLERTGASLAAEAAARVRAFAMGAASRAPEASNDAVGPARRQRLRA